MSGDINVNISKDAAGLSKPLTKLVETVGQGVGVVGNYVLQFDAKKIRRISKAEAEAEKLKIISRAKAEGEALLMLGRASHRFQLEQYSKQVNLENIFAKTKEQLERDDVVVSEVPVDTDWSARFIDVGQDISSDDIQDILATIFKDELILPGSSSKRLLEFLRSTDREEIEKFAKFATVSSDVGFYSTRGLNNAALSDYSLNVDDIRSLADIGLVTLERQISMPIELLPEKAQFLIYQDKVVSLLSADKLSFGIPIMTLSKLGAQLYRHMSTYINHDLRDKYLTDLIEYLDGHKVKAEIKRIKDASE